MKKIISIFVSALVFFSCAKENSHVVVVNDSALKAERVILGDEQSDEYLPLLKGKKVAIFSNKSGIIGDKIILTGENGEKIEQFGGFSRENVKNPQTDPTRIPFGKDENGREIAYGEHILDFLIESGVEVSAIFSPEHGFRANADAGESVSNSIDEKTGVPILSLYDDSTHSPSAENMAKFDLLLVDLQDVGLRYYTYYISLYHLMNACAENGKSVVILDRPNPNGFYVDGEILKDDFKSGVGALPIPTVHGLTFGELARMINGEGWLSAGKNSCDLTVIPCRNYTHATKYPLVFAPSPNLKDMRAIYLYASTCFFENTIVSVGRGTDFPFEAYGSPYFAKTDFSFVPKSIPGAKNPPFLEQECFGVDLREKSIESIWDEKIDLSYILNAYDLAKADESAREEFFGNANSRGYFWLDLLSGSDSLRNAILQGKSAEEIKDSWKDDVEKFKKQRKPYLLYGENSPLSWQIDTSFPNWINNANFSANNSLSFKAYKNQGKAILSISDECSSFSFYINDHKIDTKNLVGGKSYEIDISKYTQNGKNYLQIFDVEPRNLKNAVRVRLPYPVVLDGTLDGSGISKTATDLIEKIIKADIKNGFTSASLAIIKDGSLVYKNAFGNLQTYTKNGKKIESEAVSTETLYDLASATKMLAVNFAIQFLVSQNRLDLEEKIVDILGEEFATNTIDLVFPNRPHIPLDKQIELKKNITVRDLLCHVGGMHPGPNYFSDRYNAEEASFDSDTGNALYSGAGADEKTRKETLNQLFRTPLYYEPHTDFVYSDIDYMILCFVVEKITGTRLDSFLRETFWQPMNLTRITFNPLKNGFSKNDCAATDFCGNTNGGKITFSGVRENTIQGEVHDAKAYFSMAGVSGHAGLFANAIDAAKLLSAMLTGGWGKNRFFSQNVIDYFSAPQSVPFADYGNGWWRSGQMQTPRHFGTLCSSQAFGHIGFTGTLIFVEPTENLVIVYLTNKINTPMVKGEEIQNKFEGNFYQSAVAGFVPQIILMSLNKNPSKEQWKGFLREMAENAKSAAKNVSSDDARAKAYNALLNVYNEF